MKLRTFLLGLALLGSAHAMQAVELDSANRDSQYVASIVARAQKIVDGLALNDTVAAKEVRTIIANRYFKLNDIYTARDARKEALKASGVTGEEKSKEQKAIENEVNAELYRTHFAFPANLKVYLTDAQVDAVKDGMTFGVVKVTYDATLDMVPTLTDEEKYQILLWLQEAREYAIDAESSKKKHETFGRYKGRINNYLSSRGYDLVKERENWYKRIEERKNQQK
jgi:hypothetical protein